MVAYEKGRYYKVFNKEGFDFWTGKTINYGASIGKVVRVPDHEFSIPPAICSQGLIHVIKDVTDIPRYIKAYPFRLGIVEGTPLADEKDQDSKVGAKEWLLVEEIPRDKFDELFGLRWAALENLTIEDPRKHSTRAVTEADLSLLTEWVGLRGLWGLWGLRGLWELQFSYLVVEVLTEKERWLAKHTYVIPGCSALIALVREGLIPTFDYEKKEWTLWHYINGDWKEAWKGKIDASAKTKELIAKYEEATR